MKYTISNGVRIFGVALLKQGVPFPCFEPRPQRLPKRTADNYYTAYLLTLMRALHRLSKRAWSLKNTMGDITLGYANGVIAAWKKADNY